MPVPPTTTWNTAPFVEEIAARRVVASTAEREASILIFTERFSVVELCIIEVVGFRARKSEVGILGSQLQEISKGRRPGLEKRRARARGETRNRHPLGVSRGILYDESRTISGRLFRGKDKGTICVRALLPRTIGRTLMRRCRQTRCVGAEVPECTQPLFPFRNLFVLFLARPPSSSTTPRPTTSYPCDHMDIPGHLLLNRTLYRPA